MSDCPNMTQIALDQAEAGMILAQSLLDGYGAVLLPQETVLTVSTLASLRRRGVAGCVVHRAAVDAMPSQSAAERERQLQRLAHLFRHTGADAGGACLLQRLQHYRSKEQA